MATTRMLGRNLRSPGLPGTKRLRAIYSELRALPNVRGCFLGYKRKNGRNTRRLAVVCCVEAKLPVELLASGHQIPNEVLWPASTRRAAKLATDVQVVGQHTLQSASGFLGPGDVIAEHAPSGAATGRRGTIGVAMHHPLFGPVAITAAHVLGAARPATVTYPPESEPGVELSLVTGGAGQAVLGRARRTVVSENADYAVVSPPESVAVENMYVDSSPLGAPHILTPADVGSSCFVLSARGALPAVVRGVHGALQIGSLFLRDLILTDMCTAAGDSGCALVDQNSRTVGLLEGVCEVDGRPYSVFCSAIWPFIHESAAFL